MYGDHTDFFFGKLVLMSYGTSPRNHPVTTLVISFCCILNSYNQIGVQIVLQYFGIMFKVTPKIKYTANLNFMLCNYPFEAFLFWRSDYDFLVFLGYEQLIGALFLFLLLKKKKNTMLKHSIYTRNHNFGVAFLTVG